MKRKVFAWLLTLCMIVSLLPTTVLADEPTTAAEKSVAEQTEEGSSEVSINGTGHVTVTEENVTGFLDCSSGSATGYITYKNHFYKIEWTGINTAETSSVQLQRSTSFNRMEAYRNGNSSSSTILRDADGSSSVWSGSAVDALAPGESSSGYTTFDKLATGASNNSYKKVCTVTCMESKRPIWIWSNNNTTCTATFLCAENPSHTATLNATVTSSGSILAANVTFNGIKYSYTPATTYSINYVLNGGTNAESNPTSYDDYHSVTLADPSRTGYVFQGWYDNSGFSGNPITEIPVLSEGNKTFYAKWQSEIEGLEYDPNLGGFIIDSAAALNTLAAYSAQNSCEGKTFKQTKDITLSGKFLGIGCYQYRFSGTYDGCNHYIAGLYMKEYVNYMGLFLMTRNATIENVRLVSPCVDTLNSTGSSGGDGIGGLIGATDDTTVKNCYVLDPTVKGKSYVGAIIGWQSGGTVSDSYYYSDTLSPVGRGDGTATRLRKLMLPIGVTGGSVTASGDGVKITYDGATYCVENETITLTIKPEAGKILDTFTVKHDNFDVEVSGTGNTRSFTMPADDVTVTATFKDDVFSYVDLDGSTKTVVAQRITSDSAVGLYSGWYAVSGEVTRSSGLNLVAGGDGVYINIILCDGATLNLPNSTINTAGGGRPNLVIWGQEENTGSLSCVCMADNMGSVTVNGGKLQCGVSNYNCAINGNLTVNRGEVHLTAGFNTCVNGNFTFNGGIADVKKVSGNTTLNWKDAEKDSVKASQYVGSVTVADGKYFKDANGTCYGGTLTDAQKNAIQNVELKPALNVYTVTVDGSIQNGTVTADKTLAAANSTVTLTVTPDIGYEVESVKFNGNNATKVDDTHYSFTMPAANVTVTATFEFNGNDFSVEGDVYVIHTAAGWNVFCNRLASNSFSGKTVKLADDFDNAAEPVSKMANGFKGTFDGNGRTLTVNILSDEDQAAPFTSVEDATIRNLTVNGTVTTSEKHSSGLVGHCLGNTTIENCRVSAVIICSVDGDGTVGGFVGEQGNASGTKTTIRGCVFDGKLLTTSNTGNCGGFVGWSNATTVIADCLYAPAAIAEGETEVVNGTGSYPSCTFTRGYGSANVTLTNCYYTRSLGTVQGKQAYTVSAGDDVTVDFGTGTEYNVSGITAHQNGISYTANETTVFYAGSGDSVSLTLSHEDREGYAFNNYSVNAGTLSGENGSYTLSMPAADVTLTATYKKIVTVTANHLSKTYGENDPELTATVTGLDDGETLNYTLSRTAGENVGEYEITVTLGENPDYAVTATNGTFTITPASVTLTANSGNEAYDGTEKTVTGFTSSVSGLTFTGVTASGSGTNVGSYDVTFSGVTVNETKDSTGNYVVTGITNGTLTITPKAVTVKADDKTKVYDNDASTDPALTAAVTGAASGDTINYSLSRAAGQNVGTYVITVTPGSNPNYTVSVENGSFTITKKAATVTADPKAKTYGAADPALSAAVEGVVNGDMLNYTLSRAAGENVGSYVISVTLGENPNYDVSAVNGSFTIGQKAATVTAVDASKVYGDADPTLTATVEGLVGNDTLNYTLNRTEGENVGEYEITVTLGENPNYQITTGTGTFTISPKAATVTAVDASKVYGDTDPTLTATVEGLVGNDTLNYTLTRAEGENVGTYTITVTLGENPNYNVNTTNGTLTINPASVTLTASSGTETYDGTEKTVTGFTSSVNGLTFPGVTASGSGTNAGTYDVTFTGVTVNETKDSTGNYVVTGTTNGTLTINPASVTLTANSGTETYDGTEKTVTGFTSSVNGLTFPGVTASGSGTNAGTYDVTFSGVTVNETKDSTGNYVVTGIANGKLTITPKSITIKADDKTKVYDNDATTDPALTATVTGAVEGDTINYSLSRAEGQNVGSYAITVTAGSNPNYTVSVESGSFEITPKSITIKADDKTKVYDNDASTDPALTATVTGAVEGDTINYSLSRAEGQNVGSYAITVTAGSNPNYTVSVESGSFEITPKSITIKADDKTKVYDNDAATDPALTATVTGAVEGDTINYSLSRAEGQNVGEYEITVTLGENPNYDVTATNGTFTITKAAQEAPAAPTAQEITDHSITLTPVEGMEYRLGEDGAWQTDNVFENLETGTKYTFYQRLAADENHEPSEASEGAEISTSNSVFEKFVDVPRGSYFYDPVYWAVAKGITAGTDETHFSPKLTCTRAQIVTFLWRAAGSPEPTTENKFTDVKKKAYYYKAVLWAVENGITGGTSDTTFSPNAACSRGQIVMFLWRSAGSPEPAATECKFTDVKKKAYYYKAVLWATENNVTAGTSETTFSPMAPCTRAQIVTFLYRYMAG